VAEATDGMVDRKQSERKGLGTRCNFQGHAPSDLLPAAKLNS
jgi:hypothetical protein